MRTLIIVCGMLLFGVRDVRADEAVTPSLFDDQNRNQIPDHEEAPAVTTDPNLPSEESVDADQPIDPPEEGGEG